MEKQKVLHIVSVSVALVIQHATRMRHIILSAACVAPHYVINGTIFGEKFIEYKMCFDLSTILSKTFLILRKTQRDIDVSVCTYYVRT
jgi:hypothetical protein